MSIKHFYLKKLTGKMLYTVKLGNKTCEVRYSWNYKILCDISGSHGSEYEVYSLLGCSAV
jgi:hypothetical protein